MEALTALDSQAGCLGSGRQQFSRPCGIRGMSAHA